jgi:hypothetical protein
MPGTKMNKNKRLFTSCAMLLVVCFFANGQFANDVQILKLFPIYSCSTMMIMLIRRFEVVSQRSRFALFTPFYGTSGKKGSKTTTTTTTTTTTSTPPTTTTT